MNTELQTCAAQVAQAMDYFDVFGPCDGDTACQPKHVTKCYRRLARVLHPDGYTDATEKAVATEAFARFQQLHSQAQDALKDGTYGQPRVLVSVQTRKGTHELKRHLVDGDISMLYLANSKLADGTRDAVCKIAKSPADKDLFDTEAAALKRLRGPGTNEKAHPYVPELLDSFMYQEKGKPNRRANVLARLEGFYTLRQVREAFPAGLDPLDASWIWRRLLVALTHAHVNNVVHGAVLPEHVMILPAQHGVVLVDWCYASIASADDGADKGVYPAIKAVVGAYREWYPEEVLQKQPPGAATDIALAARTMVYLMGGDAVTGNLPATVPQGLRAFFKGCLLTKQAARPSDALGLLNEFDELLERLGKPYFPRRFRPFAMPAGTA